MVAHLTAHRSPADERLCIVWIGVHCLGEHFVGDTEIVFLHSHTGLPDVWLRSTGIEAFEFTVAFLGLGIVAERIIGVGLLIYYGIRVGIEGDSLIEVGYGKLGTVGLVIDSTTEDICAYKDVGLSQRGVLEHFVHIIERFDILAVTVVLVCS